MIVNLVFKSGFNFGFYVNGFLSYSFLVETIEKHFPQLQIASLNWKDEDGDLITFSSQEELNEAILGGTATDLSEEINIYMQELQEDSTSGYVETTPCTSECRHHRNRHCRKDVQKRLVGEEILTEKLPDFFSGSKVSFKIKRRLRRCERKRRQLRHRIPAPVACYAHQKKNGRRHQEDLNETLASMSISENVQKS